MMIPKKILVLVLLTWASTSYLLPDHQINMMPHVCKWTPPQVQCGCGCSDEPSQELIMSGSSTINAKPDQAIINAQMSASGRDTADAVDALAALTK
jgi:uncharacterized protein YggE